MNTYASLLTEDALIAAEEEQGEKFCSSFRKFLLDGKVTILNDDNDTLPLSIIPIEVLIRNYDIDVNYVGPFAVVTRK